MGHYSVSASQIVPSMKYPASGTLKAETSPSLPADMRTREDYFLFPQKEMCFTTPYIDTVMLDCSMGFAGEHVRWEGGIGEGGD